MVVAIKTYNFKNYNSDSDYELITTQGPSICSIPDLPHAMAAHTVDFIDGRYFSGADADVDTVADAIHTDADADANLPHAMAAHTVNFIDGRYFL